MPPDASALTLPDGFTTRAICPLCDSPRSHLYVPFRDIPVHRCDDCTFIYPAVVMTPEGARRYYREVFASPWHRQGQRLNSFVNASALSKMLDFRSIRRFLDVGTGYGFLLHRLSTLYGTECIGTEPSVEEARWAKESLGVNVINNWLSESGLPEASFDCVACFEVIEHVQDPRAFVRELMRFVRPGGLVLINTDNFRAPAVRTLGPQFAKWIPHSHVSDFSPATLERVMLGEGLQIDARLSYTAWENALRALLLRGRPPRPASECFDLQKELGREMNRAYRFWPLRLAIARAWFELTWRDDLEGSMMYLAARKPR